jgi:hypothetical protein
MKYLTIILILYFPLLLKAQSDSTYYEKRDTQWVEVRVITKPFTKVDTLIRNTLMNQIHDKTLQLYQLQERLKEEEASTIELFKTNNRQLKSFNKLPEMPKDTLKGNWLLNDVQVTIKSDKIGVKKLTWYSPVAFEYQNELFIKQEKDLWISSKSRLIKIKAK